MHPSMGMDPRRRTKGLTPAVVAVTALATVIGGAAGVWSYHALLRPRRHNFRTPEFHYLFVRQGPPRQGFGVQTAYFRIDDPSYASLTGGEACRVTLPDGEEAASTLYRDDGEHVWWMPVPAGYGPGCTEATCEIFDWFHRKLGSGKVSLPPSVENDLKAKRDPRLVAYATKDAVNVGYLGKPVNGWDLSCQVMGMSHDKVGGMATFHNAVAQITTPFPGEEDAVSVKISRSRNSTLTKDFAWSGLSVIDKDGQLFLDMPQGTFMLPGIGSYVIPAQTLPIERRSSKALNEVFAKGAFTPHPLPVSVGTTQVFGNFKTAKIDPKSLAASNISGIHLPLEISAVHMSNAFGMVKPGKLGPVTVTLTYDRFERSHYFDAVIPIEKGKDLKPYQTWIASHPTEKAAPASSMTATPGGLPLPAGRPGSLSPQRLR